MFPMLRGRSRCAVTSSATRSRLSPGRISPHQTGWDIVAIVRPSARRVCGTATMSRRRMMRPSWKPSSGVPPKTPLRKKRTLVMQCAKSKRSDGWFRDVEATALRFVADPGLAPDVPRTTAQNLRKLAKLEPMVPATAQQEGRVSNIDDKPTR